MKSIFTKSIYDKRWALLAWSIGLITLSGIVIAFYPSFGKNTQALEEVAKSIPPQLSTAFGRNFLLGGSVANYLQGEMMGLNTPLFVIIMCISLSVSLFASDEANNTLTQLLVRPLSRTRVVLEKWFAMLTISFTAMAALVSTTFIATAAIRETLPVWLCLQAFFVMWLLGVCFGSLVVFIWAISANKGLSIGIPAAWAALTYLAYSFGLTVKGIEKLKYFSWWYYYAKDQAIISGVKANSLIVLSCSIVILVLLSLWLFRKRDINIG